MNAQQGGPPTDQTLRIVPGGAGAGGTPSAVPRSPDPERTIRNPSSAETTVRAPTLPPRPAGVAPHVPTHAAPQVAPPMSSPPYVSPHVPSQVPQQIPHQQIPYQQMPPRQHPQVPPHAQVSPAQAPPGGPPSGPHAGQHGGPHAGPPGGPPQQPPGVARARARVGAPSGRPTPGGASPGTGVGGVRPLPRPGSFGRGPLVGVLLWWQILGAAVLATIDGPMPVTIGVGIAAGILAVPPVLRRRGRSLPGWAVVWARYRARPRRLVSGRGDIRLDLLNLLEPALVVDTIDVDGAPVAALTHPWGLSALVEVYPAEPGVVIGEPVLPAPPAALLPVDLLPAADAAGPPVTVSLLTRVVPAPSPRLHGTLVAEAYQELTGSRVPVDRRAWLAVQVRRTPSAHSDDDLRPALVAAVQRLQRRLRRDKVPARPLDRAALLTTTAFLAGLDNVGAGTYGTARERPLALEKWNGIAVGASTHACYRLARWRAPGPPLDPLLCALPVGAATLGVAMTRNGTSASPDAVAVEMVVRLSDADPRQLRAGERALRAAVGDAGGALARMSGEQRWGFAATLPFGGLLR